MTVVSKILNDSVHSVINHGYRINVISMLLIFLGIRYGICVKEKVISQVPFQQIFSTKVMKIVFATEVSTSDSK